MTFISGEPVATRTLATSQPIIKDNFTLSNQYFGIDHYAFDDPSAFKGLHKVCRFQAASTHSTAATQCAIYSKNQHGRPELYFRRESSGTEILMTNYHSPTDGVLGSSFLPGGLLIQWGISGVIARNGDEVETFDETFTVAPYSIVLTGIHHGGEVVSGNVHTVNLTDFTLRNTSDSARQFYWMAIGQRL
jgi:hypothetical protein